MKRWLDNPGIACTRRIAGPVAVGEAVSAIMKSDAPNALAYQAGRFFVPDGILDDMAESAEQLIHELTEAGILSSDEVTSYDREIAVGVEAFLERLVEDGRITQYQADKFLAGQASDIYFGDYLVMEEIGRGGMGTVLLARHRRMDREVAIKILPVTALDSETAVARFYQEVKVAAKLSHPNIVHAYDAGEHHGFHYLVMEYVRGHDLARVLQQLGPLPVHLALDYMIQAAEGLLYAHRKGIVHRDIKPSNLLLDDEGTVKVLDLGLARVGGISGEISTHLTTTGQVMGTVEYMSPEQAEDTRAADQRADIYSLGCCLYKLATGKSPFARDTVVKTILAHREAPIPQISSTVDPAGPLLNPLLARMLAKNPDDRYASIDLLLEDLRDLNRQLGGADKGAPTIGSLGGTSTTGVGSSGQMGTGARSGDYPSPSHVSDEIVQIKPHRGTWLLTMGALSLLTFACLLGVVLAIMTWVYARNDLDEMERGLRDVNGRAAARAAKLMGQVALLFAIVVFIGAAIGSLLGR